MDSINKSIFFIIIIFLFYSTVSVAKVQYVTDKMVIDMRSGKDNSFKIIKFVKSGTPMTILKTDSGYTKARTPQGVEGWVLSRFLINTPVARDLLEKAQQDVTTMKSKFDAMANELNAIKKDREILSKSEKTLLSNKEKMNAELIKLKKISARPRQLQTENKQLRNELVKNEAEMRLLQQEYQTLDDNTEQQWFIKGAGVLFGGMLLGLILPKLRSGQKKANWNRL
jgi:SH3 domain protein